MSIYFLWGGIAVLAIFLLIGLISGLIRGLKRSSLHLLFFVASIIVAFFITKPITNAILGITISVDGTNCTISDWIVNLIQTNFDISQFATATDFIANLPMAIVSPILFLLLSFVCVMILDIIYLIIARVCFGSKKQDFKNHKPYRAYGALVGIVEGFIFMFLIFAPVTSLTNLYTELCTVQSQEVQTTSQAETSGNLKTIREQISSVVPAQVNEAILAYNDCVVGKIASTGGINDKLFDYLSSFDLNGQKIEFRKEVINIVDVYDEFVVVYNDIQSQNYENIDMTSLKENIETFLNNGIFKTVVADTINTLVVNFEDIQTSLNITLPEFVQDIITDLQTTFKAENFDTYRYLKEDIIKVVNIFDTAINGKLIENYKKLEDKSFVGILDFISQNNASVKSISQDVLKLNIVKDAFSSLGKFASTKIEEILQNDKGLEIALNTEIADKDKMITDVLSAVDDVLSLNNMIDISSLLTSTDIVESLTSVENLAGTIDKIGTTFDKLRNLEILVLPEGEERTEKVYVFDNILSLFDVELLGDEVYLTTSATTKTKLDTYTQFFSYIKNPIVTAKDLGLTDIGKEGTTFDRVIDKILTGLETNETLLNDIMLPFYQLSAMDLKTLVFDNIINELSTNVSMLNFEEIKTENNYQTWKEELGYLGTTLKTLNQGSVGTENKTYIKYLLGDGADLEVVMKAMLNDGNLNSALEQIFTAKVFKTLTSDIFDNIDTSIGELTGIKPVTKLDNLNETKNETILAINNLLSVTLNNESLGLVEVGKILDVLKTNAYNQGSKDGVFNEIFANIIWYMTGDNITGVENKFAGGTPNENSADVKAYLKVESTNNYVGYYTFASYENAMKNLEEVVDFATNLANSVEGITLSDSKISTYVTNIKNAIDSIEKTEEQKIQLIKDLKDLMDNNPSREKFLTEEQKTKYGASIKTAIENEYGASSELGTALKNLFGVNA